MTPIQRRLVHKWRENRHAIPTLVIVTLLWVVLCSIASAKLDERMAYKDCYVFKIECKGGDTQ